MEETQDPKEFVTSDRLDLLYRLSQSFNSSLELDHVLNTVMDEVIVAMNAERGFIILSDQAGEYQFQAARGMELETIKDPDSQISHGVVDKVLEEGESVVTMDAQADGEFSGRESVRELKLRSIVAVPLQIHDQLLGAIYIDNRLREGIFTNKEKDLLTAIASTAAIAIENARLYQVAVDKGRLERELQMAREVQESHMPESVPELAGWEVATRWVPAREVAGDFFDFIDRGKNLGVVIADVVDKGMPAALFMASCRSAIRACVRHGIAPDDIVTVANRVICTDTTSGMFLSFMLVELEAETGKVSYVNAGHPPALLYRNEAETIEELSRTGMIVGVDVDASYDSRSLSMEVDDCLLLYTDGVTDVINNEGELFGEARFLELVRTLDCTAPVDDRLTVIEEGLKSFAGGSLPTDDITLVMVRRV